MEATKVIWISSWRRVQSPGLALTEETDQNPFDPSLLAGDSVRADRDDNLTEQAGEDCRIVEICPLAGVGEHADSLKDRKLEAKMPDAMETPPLNGKSDYRDGGLKLRKYEGTLIMKSIQSPSLQ